MAINTCVVSGNVKDLLGQNVSGVTVKVSTLTPFYHTGSLISGEIKSTTTDSSGDWSLEVIETETVGKKLTFTFEYNDGAAGRKRKAYTVIVPNSAAETLSDLITSETFPATITTLPAANVTIAPGISNLDALTAQTGFAELQGDIDQLETDVDTAQSTADDHIADADGAHAASAISSTPSGNLESDNVQDALDELQSDVDTRALDSDLDSHVNAAVDAHDASAVSFDNTDSGLTATDVQEAIDEVDSDLDSHKSATTSVHGIADTSDLATQSGQNTFSDVQSFSKPLDWTEQGSSPSTPSAGTVKVYAKNDGKLYKLASDGIEQQIGAGAGGQGGINLLDNGRFSDGTANWTASGNSTLTVDDSEDIPVATWTPDADGDSLTADPVEIGTVLAGNAMEASIWYKHSESTEDAYTLQVLDNSLNVIDSVELPAATKLTQAVVRWRGSSTSTDDVSLRILSSGPPSSAIELALARIGEQTGVGNGANIGEWEDYTPTTQGIGTPTFSLARYRRVGDSAEIEIQFTTGTAEASEFQMGLPPGLTVHEDYSLTKVGELERDVASDIQYAVLATGGDSFLNAGRRTSSVTGIFTAQNGNTLYGNSSAGSLKATVKIQNWSATNNVVQASTSGFQVDAMIKGENGEDLALSLGTSTDDDFVKIAGTLELEARDWSNSVQIANDGSDDVIGFTAHFPKAGVVDVCFDTNVYLSPEGGDDDGHISFRIVRSENDSDTALATSDNVKKVLSYTGSTTVVRNGHSVLVCDSFKLPSAGTYTFKLQKKLTEVTPEFTGRIELGVRATARYAEETQSVNVVLDSLVPTGSVLPFAGSEAPSGFLMCDGSAVSRSTYAKLFSVIGEAHGEGDGSTTFNLPDYRGRFLRGVDGGAGNDPDADSRTAMATGGNTGDAVGSVQDDAFQGHRHTMGIYGGSFSDGGSPASMFVNFGLEENRATSDPTSDGTNGTPRTSSESRPKNAYVNYIIKT